MPRPGKLKFKNLRPRIWLLLVVCLAAIVPFNFAVASRTNIIIYQLLMVGLFTLLFWPGGHVLPKRYNRLLIGLALLIGWISVSCLWSFSQKSALNTTFIYGTAVLLFISLLVLLETARTRCLWLWGYFGVAAAAAATGLVAFGGDNVQRVQIGLMLANSTAGFLLPAVIVALFDWRKLITWTLPKQLVGSIMGLIILAGFFLTFSRGSFVCLAAASLIILWFRYSKRLAIISALLLGCLLVGYVVLSNQAARTVDTQSQSLVERGLVRDSSTTLHDRQIYAKTAIELFGQYPLFGAGAGSYRVAAIASQSGVNVNSTNAHNSLLQFMAEFGLVGLALLSYVSWQVLGFLRTIVRKNIAVVAALLALALHFMIEIDLIYPPMVLLLASFTALTVSAAAKRA